MELHVVTYDMHPLRDLLAGRGEPFEFEVLFHPWLFPDLEYRQTRDAKVEVAPPVFQLAKMANNERKWK